MATDQEATTAVALSVAYFIAAFRSGQAKKSMIIDLLVTAGVVIMAGIMIFENL
jgi:hypothetical protein